jgi:peptide/nickel transport system substrate-binding protein
MTQRPEMTSIERLVSDAADGRLSRRDLVKRAGALGLGAPIIAAMLNVAAAGSTAAQTPMTLSFDAAATGGGGGKPGAELKAYCFIVDGGSQFELERMVDARLITLSADLQNWVGDLAESWEIKDTTATFHLRKNAKWHDGQPVTAKDVVFTINMLTDPATTSRWGASFMHVVGYDEAQKAPTPTSLSGLTAPDDYTVQIELTQPDSGMQGVFMFIDMLPEHILGSIDRAKLPEQPFWREGRIGAGPYKLVKVVEGERMELEANPDYYMGKPQIEKLNLLFFSSFDTSLAAFQKGDSLAAPMTANDVQLVKGTQGAEILTTPAGVGAIEINCALPDFSDKRVRQAMSYAIDRKTICDQLFLGYADPVASELPYLKWTQPADLNPYDYDADKAKSLLKDAGWKGDKTYTLWYYYPDQITAAVMEAMQQYLQAVGVNVDIKFDDGGGERTKQFNDHTWQLTYGSYGAQPAPANLTIIFGSQAKDKWSYSNPEFDKAMESALGVYSQEEQAPFYQQAIKILNEDCPWVWLFDRKNLIAVNNGHLVTGDKPAWGAGSIRYENYAWEWTVK